MVCGWCILKHVTLGYVGMRAEGSGEGCGTNVCCHDVLWLGFPSAALLYFIYQYKSARAEIHAGVILPGVFTSIAIRTELTQWVRLTFVRYGGNLQVW